jgi:D-lactate dehydrogenase
VKKEITCFNTHEFEINYLSAYAETKGLKVHYITEKLDKKSVHHARNSEAILCWASDKLDHEILESLKEYGCSMISLRCAGYGHLDIVSAKKLGFTVTRSSAYSPESIAEHATALYLCLNRKIIQSYQRVKNFNFSLEGLEGQQVHGKQVGIIGSGLIGRAFLKIMIGLGMKVLIYDPYDKDQISNTPNVTYTDLDTLLKNSDLISLHCPLTSETKHLLNYKTLSLIKPGAFLINTGRGALIDTKGLIRVLKENKLGGVGLDVYEFEEDIFSFDLSENGIKDDDLVRIMSFPNVIVTSHQGFFTKEALENIAEISITNVVNYLENTRIDKKNILIS